MPELLIVYASTHGHTGKIAERVAQAARAAGAGTEVLEVSSAQDVSPSDYDAVVVGASIHAGHHQREIVDWAKRHASVLSDTPSALFSVCLAAAEDTDESREATRKYLDDFADETGWTPRRTQTFAGALQYLEYNYMTRLAIRLMMQRGGHPTDTSRDHDFTDWDAVERFGRECAADASGGAAS